MNIPELLAPAGDMQAFYAAVANGADAVYVGGKAFSARAQADNFSDQEMIAAISYAHFYNVKVYCAVNTLIADTELDTALDYVYFLYQQGIDAVIVQDFGFMLAIRRLFPQLPCNVSTQMTITNSDGVHFLEHEGVKRVILARELSATEIKEINQKTEIETEIFVHGALCVCYSGQCLMSSMIGGRSGNRGRCAQPCRLPYALIDKRGEEIEVPNGEYLLSPKDLFGIVALDEVLETGVSSLKIEGRMKRPEYVAVVTDNYRRLLDGKSGKAEMPDYDASLAELKQIFNRDFAAGYLEGNLGSELTSGKKPNNRGVFLGRVEESSTEKVILRLEMALHSGDGLEIWVTKGGRTGFTAETLRQNGQIVQSAPIGSLVELDFPGRAYKGDRVFKTNDSILMAKALVSINEEKTVPLDMKLIAHLGENARLEACDADGFKASVEDNSYQIVLAQKRVADREYLEAQLGRLGGSGFCLHNLIMQTDENIMLPASVLNNLRRIAVQKLREQREKRKTYQLLAEKNYLQQKHNLFHAVNIKRGCPLLSAWVTSAEAAKKAAEAGAKEIYFDENGFESTVQNFDYAALRNYLDKKGARLCAVLPQIYAEAERSFWKQKILEWQQADIQAIRCDSIGAIELAHECDFQGELLGGVGLNVFNSLTAQGFYDRGLSRLLISQELTLEQLAELNFAGEKEVAVHGAAQLMLSQHCLLGGTLGGRTSEKACSMPCKQQNNYGLKDKKDFIFPMLCDRFCRMHIFNARELCMLTDLTQLQKAGATVFCLDLRLADAMTTGKIIALYNRALQGESADMLMLQAQSLSKCGFTKGHYYRGV